MIYYSLAMSELPLSSKYRTNPTGQVDDDERADLTERLSAEFTAGRIDQDDYLAKLDVIYNAAQLGDLAPVVATLPPRVTHGVPDIVLRSKNDTVSPGSVSPNRNLVPILAGAAAGAFVILVLVAVLVAMLVL